jgi:hypothetical protein
MLVKTDAGLLRDACGVGIQSLKKIPDLPLNLHTARPRDRWPDLNWLDSTWLDLTLHFRLPTHPSEA